MTTTNDRTDTTQPPAWLNLDAYCPPVIRDQLNAAADGLAALLDPDSDFMRAARAAFEAADAYQQAIIGKAPTVDDDTVTFGAYTGWARFEALCDRVAAAAAVTLGDEVGYRDADLPAWYVPWAERRGLDAEAVSLEAEEAALDAEIDASLTRLEEKMLGRNGLAEAVDRLGEQVEKLAAKRAEVAE